MATSRLRTWLPLVVALVLTACGAPATGPAHPPLVTPDRPGALLGAYVAPQRGLEPYTDAGRIAAVERFEAALGRPLGVVMTYHPWAQPFPSRVDRWVVDHDAVLMLSWGGTSTEEILSGRYDAMIRSRAKALKALGGPVLLRWRWEMNRPNLQREIGSPELYVKAWKHLRAVFDEVDADEVDWVWCPLARDFTASHAPAYYPGDDQVEWLCTDAYTASPADPLATALAPFLAWAEGHDKPVAIGELGTHPGPGRDLWLRRALSSLRAERQVKAALYYESDNAAAGRYALSGDAPAMAELRTWGAKTWSNPAWADRLPPSE